MLESLIVFSFYFLFLSPISFTKAEFKSCFIFLGTYMNCQRTKRCIQCNTDRPLRYATPPFINNQVIPIKQTIIHTQPHKDNNSISRALNKWTCQSWLV